MAICAKNFDAQIKPRGSQINPVEETICYGVEIIRKISSEITISKTN